MKNLNYNSIIKKVSSIKNLQFVCLILVFSLFSFSYSPEKVIAADTTGPIPTITYTSNPIKTGTQTITTTYNEGVTSAPTISINQPGSTDISNAAMTTAPSMSSWAGGMVFSANAWNAVAYGNGTFVTVAGNSGTRVMSSTDGINWTGRSDVDSTTSWFGVTYGNGLFVAVGGYGSTYRIMTSPDGITWTGRSAPATSNWTSVAYGNGKFIVVSKDGSYRALTSPDGITWTAQNPGAQSWYGITYGNATENNLFVAVSAEGVVQTTADGVTWTTRTAAASNAWMSVTYGNGRFVAVSSNGANRVMTSPDGVTWTSRSATEANQWWSVTYGAGLFVAVSYDGTNRVMTSVDGATWTARAAAAAIAWQGVAYGNGKFVAVGAASPYAMYATWTGPVYTYNYTVNTANGSTYVDGTATVSLSTVQDAQGNNSSAPSANTFAIDTTGPTVALSYNKNPAGAGAMTITATYSETPSTMPNISINQPGSTDISSVAMSGSGTVRTYSYTVNTANGSTYIDGTATVSLSSTTDALGNTSSAPTNNTFTIDTTAPTVTLSYSSNPAKAGAITITATYSKSITSIPNISIDQPGSTDITTQAMTGSGSVYTYSYTVVAATGSTYIDGTATVSLSATTDAAGNSSSAPTNTTFTIDTTVPTVALTYTASPKGVGTQTVTASYSEAITSTPTISINQPGSTDISSVIMNGGPAGTWTARSATAAATWRVTYGNNLFVAVSDSGLIMTSSDGTTWTSRTSPSASGWTSVTYGNNLFVAVSVPSPSKVMTSPDGITWTNRTPSEESSWQSVTYGNGLFVAVATNGTNRVMTSPDGITWTSRSAAEANNWVSVTYGNGLFVAVATTGTNRVMTSTNGTTWTARAATEANSWYSVTYGNGLFVAVASNGTNRVMTSPDGITWTARTAAEANSWYAVTYGGNLFVATAISGTNRVMTSPDGTTWTARAAAEANNWISITYGNNLFVAVSNTGTHRVMTSPSTSIYTYDYTINLANGSTYIDGTATVSLSATTDAAGNSSSAPTNNTFEIDTTGPTVALTYSKNPAGVGTNTITATYNKTIVGTPTISINQPGSTDISAVAMSGSGTIWTYDYTVNTATGSTYIDGTATVSLSTVTDSAGNNSSAPTNNTFVIDTVGPSAAITYSINRNVKSGESLVITATFDEALADSPVVKIALSGANTLAATAMTKVDTTHYTYTHTVGAGNDVVTAVFSVGTDVGGNPVVATPTSGATFTVDDTLPTVSIDAICSVVGNGCTVAGQNASPQESFSAQSITGTAGDTTALDKVEISIKDTTTNKWYSGTSFTSDTEVYLTTTGTSTWNYNSSTVSLVIDHIYSVNAKATDTATNTQVQNLTFKFTNSPPTVSNVTASQNSSGVVNVTYDVTDIESTQTTNYLFYGVGVTLDGTITSGATSLTVSDGTFFPTSGDIMIDDEIISYTSKTVNVLNGLTRGALSTVAASHSTSSGVFIKAVTVTGTGIGLSDKGTGKSITWTPKTDVDGYESLTGVIKVVANDGSTGSMIGSLSSSTFALDVKTPSAVVTFDAGVAGVTNSATITIPKPTDQSTVEYKISDDSVTQTDPTNTGWVSITSSTTIPWTFDSGVEAKTIKYQYRDAFGNVTTETATSTQAPISASSFLVQDSSNINIPTYDMYVAWAPATPTGFSSYKLEYATSSDNVTYGSYTSVVGSGVSDPTTEYYVHRNLDSTKYYKYRLGVVGTNGNISIRAGAAVVTKPDGVQNFGEGGGGSVATASKVQNVVPTQGTDKNVTITYLLTDSTLASKTTPTYEGYVFYNIGVVLPSSPLSGDNLTISDASKLKSSGFIQINNEVIKYTNKTDNVLSGLTRGTWPTDATSRTTRQNTTFFAGTPVWILASGTSPVSITNNTITAGQSGSISWTTSSETGLSGGVYSDVGIKILIHDNQDSSSSPLSSQNDYTEDGILAVLDLSNPATGSAAIKSTSAVISWTTVDYADSLIEYGTVAPGEEGAYSLSKTNADKVLEHTIYLSGLTPSTTYYFKTTSTNVDGEATVSTSDFTTTAGPVLSSVASSGITDTSAIITWTTDTLSTSYVNYSTSASLTSPTRFGTADLTNSHSVALTNLSSGTTYYYSVDSSDGSGNIGENTNDRSYYSFATLADQTPPIISNISTPIITTTQAAIVWTTNELTDGKVRYGTSSGNYSTDTEVITTPLTSHLATISNLTASTSYYYVVVSVDANGNSTTSPEQTFRTVAREVEIISGGGSGIMGVAQALYDALLAENANYKAKLKGTDDNIPVVSNIKIDGITAFGATVLFETSEDTIAFINYSKDKSLNLLAADDRLSKVHEVKIYGLTLGTEYNFKIKVVDRSNDIGYSEEQKFTTKFLTEDLAELKKIENVEQFQSEIEQTIESILPSLVPPFIDKPVVSDITESSAIITFRTNIKSYPIVSYAAESKYDVTKENPYDAEISDTSEKNITHTLSLVGLTPNTKYHFMVKAFSLPEVVGKSEDFAFTTKTSKIQGSILDVKKDSFTVVWTTDELASSIVEYKNLNSGRTARIVDDIKNTSHSVTIENLTPGTPYQVSISGVNEKGNEVESGNPLNVKTSTDNTPPVITNLKVESSLVAGRTDRVQVIVSWQTDEPSTSTVYYEEGSGSLKGSLANKQEDIELTKSHVAILTTLKPGKVYRFTVESIDDANNVVKPPIRTIITPKKAESIVDVIFKNFNETFNFINNVK